MRAHSYLRQRSPIEQQAAWVFLRFALAHTTPQWLEYFDGHRVIQRWLFGKHISSSSSRTILKRCQSIYEQLKTEFDDRPFYADSLRLVGDRFGLNEAERRILWLAVLHYEASGFREALGYLNSELGQRSESAYAIARMIDMPPQDVMRAIGPTGHLVEIGLLESTTHFSSLDDYLGISHRISGALCETLVSEMAMDMFLQPAPPGVLCPEDFPHLQSDFLHVSQYLRAVVQQKVLGVNVLLYGIPGTGKTEFAGLIARHLDVPMYVVPEDKTISDRERGQSRLSAYRMSQALLSSTSSLLLFDDVEDGILDWERQDWKAKTSGKAMLNNLLESNPVPSIWITNVAYQFDEAHLRRFDLSIRFKPPPRSVRTSMIEKSLGDLPLSSAFKATLAADRQLTPAQIGKIARVARCVSHQEQGANLDPLATHLYRSTYKLRFWRDPDAEFGNTNSVDFNLDFVNSSMSPSEIVSMFRRTTELTACLYGLPGTGKTAFAEHVAKALDKPLLIKRASDLLRPYLGETEMMLRQMFEEAMDEDAVLLLDEADSFLADRSGAERRWEVTTVNELLTQIERFRGYFIATTNAFDVLDLASLRRFDLKVQFDPLRLEQRLQMLESVLQKLGVDCDVAAVARSSVAVRALSDMPQLTPGDFAVALRRLSLFQAQADLSAVLYALAEEHQYKQHIGRSIGFTS